MRRMIFHAPFPLDEHARTASGIRPLRLRNAFRQLGYEVTEVVGHSHERSAAIRAVRAKLKSGVRFDFCYSESSTMPMSMTDPHHLPLHPLMDYGLFRDLRRHGTPVGHFLRDIYWRFPDYRESVAFPKREFALAGYSWDLRQLSSSVDVLYLPNKRMAKFLPNMAPAEIESLPPGHGWENPTNSPSEGLRLFYVGGTGNHYRLHRLVEAVTRTHREGVDVELTLCTPPEQWAKNVGEYAELLSDAIRVVSAHGEALVPLYESAHVGVLAVEPLEYRTFAVPVKFFDYLGAGKPILASNGTLTAEMAEEERIGWGVDYTVEALSEWIRRAASDPSILAERQAQLDSAWSRHTWLSRAQSVAADLTAR